MNIDGSIKTKQGTLRQMNRVIIGANEVGIRYLYNWLMHAVGWGEGQWALATQVKAIRVGVGLIKKYIIPLTFNLMKENESRSKSEL